jgi:hypothetical protein
MSSTPDYKTTRLTVKTTMLASINCAAQLPGCRPSTVKYATPELVYGISVRGVALLEGSGCWAAAQAIFVRCWDSMARMQVSTLGAVSPVWLMFSWTWRCTVWATLMAV